MRKIVYLAAALPLLVACNNKGAEEVQQPLTPFEKGQQLSITSQPINEYERSMARKVHVREEMESSEVCSGDESFVTRLLWDAGDQIDVFVDDNGQTHSTGEYPQSVFTLTSGANTSEGTFSGTMPASGTEYAIMYPHRPVGNKTIVEDYTEGKTFPYKVTQFSMPAVQTYRSPKGNTDGTKEWPTFASGLLPIFGKGTLDSGFVTYPCGGAMRFKLWSENGEKVASIRLASIAKEGSKQVLSGSFKITPTESGSVVMNMESNGSTSNHAVILEMPDNFTLPKTVEDAVWIYFVLPAPLTFTGGFGIYIYDTKITSPDAPSATPIRSFVTTTAQPQIKQNHITTIVFGDSNDKGNKGNINGDGWKP